MTTTIPNAPEAPIQMITRAEAAQRIGVAEKTLANWWSDRMYGPTPIRYGSKGARVRYVSTEVNTFIADLIKNNAAD